MRIGELAQRTGVATNLLRYYEAQGLLRPERRGNGYRDYDAGAVTAVNQIRGLLEAGLSTQEIARLLPCASSDVPDLEPCPEVLDLLRSRLAALDDRIGLLNNTRDALGRYLCAAERASTTH